MTGEGNMKTLLKIELERAFKNKWFYITLCIELVLVIADVCTVALPARMAYEEFYIPVRDYQIPGTYCYWMVVNNGTVYRLFHFIFPLLISIPYVFTIYNDIKSNYVYNITSRIDKSRYYLSKLLTQFIVGTAVVAFALISSFVLTAAILPLEHPTKASAEYNISVTKAFPELFYNHTFVSVIVFIVLESVVFGIIGCIGFIFSYLLNNVIMVMLSSFIIYYMDFVLSNLCGRYGSLMTASKIGILHKAWVTGLVAELMIIAVTAVVVCIIRMKKKDIL